MPVPASTNTPIEYFDGFDDYPTAQILRFWTNAATGTTLNISSGTGRNSTNSLRITNASNYVAISLSAQTTRTIGYALKMTSFAGNQGANAFRICGVYDGTTEQTSLFVNQTGQFFFARRGTQLGAFASQNLTLGIWNYIEATITINSTTGICKLNLNGNTILSLTAQNTQYTSNPFANMVYLFWGDNNGGSMTANPVDLDDVYIRSDSTMMGDQSVESHLPTANGATIQWTPLTGSNFSEVNEAAADDNTSYVSTTALNQTDLYSFSPLTFSSGTIAALMTILQEGVDTSGQASVVPVYRNSSGTTYNGVTQFIGSSGYAPYYDIQGQDPATPGSAWLPAAINSYQYGLERIS